MINEQMNRKYTKYISMRNTIAAFSKRDKLSELSNAKYSCHFKSFKKLSTTDMLFKFHKEEGMGINEVYSFMFNKRKMY